MLPTLCVLRGIGSDFRKKYRANPAVILPPSLEMCSSISLAPLCKACRHRLRTVQAVLWLMGPMKWTICFVIRNPSNKRKNRACLVSSRGAETPAYSTSPRRTAVTGSAATVSRIRPRRHHQRHVVILRGIGDAEGEGDFVDEAGGGQGDALGGEIIAGGEHQFVAAGAQGVAFQQGVLQRPSALVTSCFNRRRSPMVMAYSSMRTPAPGVPRVVSRTWVLSLPMGAPIKWSKHYMLAYRH